MKILIYGGSCFVRNFSFIAPMRIVRAMARAGDEVKVINWANELIPKEYLEPRVETTKYGECYTLNLRQMLQELQRQIDTWKPDLIYSMGTSQIHSLIRIAKTHSIPIGIHRGDPYYSGYPNQGMIDVYKKADFNTFNEGQAWNYVVSNFPKLKEKCYILNHAIDPELAPTWEELQNVEKKYIVSCVGGDDRIRRRELVNYYYQWTNSFPEHKFAVGGSLGKGSKGDPYRSDDLRPTVKENKQPWNHTTFTPEEIGKYDGMEFNLTKIQCDLPYPLGLSHPAVHRLYSNCYDSETEILTNQGWKYFKDLDKTEKVATLNLETEELEYQQPIKYFEHDWKGDVYRVESRHLDIKVTPQHNMVVKRIKGNKQTGDWHLEKAVEVYGSGVGYKCNAEWKGVRQEEFILDEKYKFKMDDWLEFLGYYLAEGSITIANKKRKNPSYRIVLSQHKKVHPRKYKLMSRSISRLGFNAVRSKTGIEFYSEVIYNHLKNTCYKIVPESIIQQGRSFYGAPNKSMPNYVKNLAKEQLFILWKAMMLGDGSWKMTSGYYSTTSKKISDDIQEILLKIGMAGMITKRPTYSKMHNPCYIINTRQEKFLHPQIMRSRKKDWWEYYEGKVYCVEVPNHTLFVRRNGKPVWSGNSYYGFTPFGHYLCKGWQSEFNYKTYGTKFFEQMGSGCATICNRIANIEDVIIHGETGFIFDKPEDAYDAYKLAVEHPEDIREMGRKAYRFAHEKHSWDVRYRDILVPIWKKLGIK